jgi:membrane protein
LLVVVPLLLGVALSLGATITAGSTMGWLVSTLPYMDVFVETGLKHAPKFLLLIGFTFTYWFFPNTKVNITSALIGGALAAVTFSIAQEAYVGLNIGVAKYSALFGGFAALPLLLVWLYVCWVIILVGAEVSFAHQNFAHYRQEVRARGMGAAEREILGFCVALEIARAFRDRDPLSTAEGLATTLDVSVRSVREIIHSLENEGLLVECGDGKEGRGYQLRRPAEKIQLEELRIALRGARPVLHGDELAIVRNLVARLLGEIERSIESVTGSKTLAEFLEEIPEGSPTLTV